MTPAEPEELGDFRIEEKLGQGAMGTVYRAHQASLNRIVALKVLPPHHAMNPEFITRFKHEAMAAAALNHPHIVQIYAAGESGGTHFFAMEYVEGETLGARVDRKGRLDPREAIAVVVYLARALEYAWNRAKIIHRDIKPDNIFLSREGEVKLGDLGLAKVLDAQASSVTHTGTSMGTPYYVSPEQARGDRDIDFRADIYSLGCTLFHVLTGVTPYRGDSAMGVMIQHLTQPPPQIAKVWPGCPPPIVGLLDRMLRKEPDARHQSYEELIQNLLWVAEKLRKPGALSEPAVSMIVQAPVPVKKVVSPAVPVRVPLPPAAKRSRTMPAVVVVALLAIGALVWSTWKKPPPNKGGSVIPNATEAASDSLTTATKDTPFVNTLGMKFVPVPGTKVLFSVWDTRVQDYAAYARVNKVDDSWTKQEKDSVPVSRGADYPVVGVSWDDANAFCRWLTENETAAGKLPKGAKYRLPTDEEWSQAVGLPVEQGATPAEKSQKNSTDFPWGVGYPPPKAKVGNYMDRAFHEKFPKEQWIEGYTDGYATTSPVGSFPANAYGLYDMGGNVWQWCEERGLRGASWLSWEKAELLSSVRVKYSPEVRWKQFGFRCVLVPAPVAPSAQSAAAFVAATKEQPFVNTLGMKFVPVPIIGGPTGGQRVLFCIWETRVKDYRAFAEATKHEVVKPDYAQTDDHPVVKVSWNEAEAFCEWLSKKEGFEYRLPTDHEWSCAVGIGDREDPSVSPVDKDQKIPDVFPWGTTWPPPRGAGNLADATAKRKYPDWKVIDNYDDGFANTSPVGAFAANQFGIYDLTGNVWEWCKDVVKSGDPYRYQRGACFFDAFPRESLSSRRTGSVSGNWVSGFRCVVVDASPTR